VSQVTDQWKVAFIMDDNGRRDRLVHWFDSEIAALRAVLNASRSRFVDSSTIEYQEPSSRAEETQ
jgi:hypothetical protein